MKWQIIVLLCCGWMSGVALGDTENPQKAEPDGTAVINQGQGDVMVYGISEEVFAKTAADLSVTDAALTSFFKMLEQAKVDRLDLDKKLREIAESYKKFLENAKLLEDSGDPEVNTLLRQAQESIEGRNTQGNSVTVDFAKAEALLEQARQRELQHIEELQQIEERLQVARAKKQVSAVRILLQQSDLAAAQFKYDKARWHYLQAEELLREKRKLVGWGGQEDQRMQELFPFPASPQVGNWGFNGVSAQSLMEGWGHYDTQPSPNAAHDWGFNGMSAQPPREGWGHYDTQPSPNAAPGPQGTIIPCNPLYQVGCMFNMQTFK